MNITVKRYLHDLWTFRGFQKTCIYHVNFLTKHLNMKKNLMNLKDNNEQISCKYHANQKKRTVKIYK